MELDWGINLDIAEYCRELNDVNIERRPMDERYFVKRYKLDTREDRQEDICILEHSNRICVITLAHSHPVVYEGKKITKIEFLDIKTGKQWTHETSPVCRIICDDGNVYSVLASIRGKLIEVNERLLVDPQLLVDKPNTEGYLAMLLPRKLEHSTEMQRLSSAEVYEHLLETRQKSTDS